MEEDNIVALKKIINNQHLLQLYLKDFNWLNWDFLPLQV